MPSSLTRFLLFLSSYTPLLAILAIRNSHNMMAVIALTASIIVSIGWMALYLRQLQGLGATRITIHRAIRRDQEIVGYLFAYLFPFLDINLADATDSLSFGVLFAVVAFLYVRLNVIYVNPLLAVAGYYLSEIEEANGKISMLLSRKPYIRPGAVLKVATAGNLVAVEVPDEHQ